MALSQEIYSPPAYSEGKALFPLLEIELTGNISFERIIDTLHLQFKIPYRLIKADIEFLQQGNFGKMLIELRTGKENTDRAIQYFNRKNIKNALKGYSGNSTVNHSTYG